MTLMTFLINDHPDQDQHQCLGLGCRHQCLLMGRTWGLGSGNLCKMEVGTMLMMMVTRMMTMMTTHRDDAVDDDDDCSGNRLAEVWGSFGLSV